MFNFLRVKLFFTLACSLLFYNSFSLQLISKFSHDRPILESKGMHAIFQKKKAKKGKKMLKKEDIFENVGNNVHNLKLFLKRAGDCM